MKKTYMIVLCVAAIAAMIPTLVIAEEITKEEKNDSYKATSSLVNIVEEAPFDSYFDNDEQVNSYSLNDSDQQYIKLRGKWGIGKDHDFDGYFGGRITVRTNQYGKRVGIFRGLFNKTGEDETYSLVGIMKNGYFIGKIITDEENYKLSGLYVIDQENHLFKMQWMIPKNAGWAVAQMQLP